MLLYYSLTTLLDSQTLGEEYIGLLQVDPSLRRLPSKLVRPILPFRTPQWWRKLFSNTARPCENLEMKLEDFVKSDSTARRMQTVFHATASVT